MYVVFCIDWTCRLINSGDAFSRLSITRPSQFRRPNEGAGLGMTLVAISSSL